ncbi:inositol monophosphatase family protein [Gephyromycinifex aptenodytis]|uniref:inositol monophosphatase family protein n=1 Tax=Gephyromycinifex aptenodytis TaxID=2716227 RepID=UPI001444A4D4|nr:inositol monophosphatase family protein [Gephyromycinifex aptenodytis]
MTQLSHDELVELERIAIESALEAAELVRQRPDDLGIEVKSSRTDVVTLVDAASEKLLVQRIRELRPQDGFYGEEEADTRAQSPLTWVLDPIDGTVNFLYDYPLYAVSVAVVEGDPRIPGQWRPIAGAVADVPAGSVYHARTGGGAYLRRDGNDERLSVTGSSDLGTSLVATGFGYDAQKRGRQARVLMHVLPQIRDIRRGGSAALDLCHVAQGRLDGYYEMGINPWDMAAGWLVLTEAGGLATGAHGAPPSSECVIAAGATLHPALAELVQDGLQHF